MRRWTKVDQRGTKPAWSTWTRTRYYSKYLVHLDRTPFLLKRFGPPSGRETKHASPPNLEAQTWEGTRMQVNGIIDQTVGESPADVQHVPALRTVQRRACGVGRPAEFHTWELPTSGTARRRLAESGRTLALVWGVQAERRPAMNGIRYGIRPQPPQTPGKTGDAAGMLPRMLPPRSICGVFPPTPEKNTV